MSGNNENIVNDNLPHQSSEQVLFVAPLNSVPYVGPSNSGASSSTSQEAKDLGAQMQTGVFLTGTAAMGPIGSAMGRIDVFDSHEYFYFRVSLPGVSSEESKSLGSNDQFSCDIEDNGTIMIKGATTTGEATICRHSQVFKMQTQHLCRPGHFTISFELPGPVHKEEFTYNLEFGVLEGKVKKRRNNSGHVQL